MSGARPHDPRAAARAIRAGSRSFWLASLLLGARTRNRALSLYRFCREADDAVDRGSDDDPAGAVARLRSRLAAIEAGSPGRADEADRDFAAVLRDCAIPIAVPAGLVEGFAWDAERRRYETLDDLLEYARRVAGTVGLMMSAAMGVTDRASLASASDLGCAMQLTNIARDVGEDARAGRLYLPLAWMREHGLDPDAFLADPRFDRRLAAVVARLLDAAEALYRDAGPAIGRIPGRRDRAAIRAAAALYREIGCVLARRGLDSVSVRTRVPAARQALLVARATASPPRPGPRLRAMDERIAGVARLFDRLERADLARASAPPRG